MSVATSRSSDFPVSRISLRSCGLRAQNSLQPVAPFGVRASPSDFQWPDLKDDLFLIFRIFLDPGPKSLLHLFPSRPTQRGVSRSSRTLGWDAMDARGAADESAILRTAKSCGPDVPTLASSFAEATPRGDGGKQARSPGRARSKLLKPSRAGMPGVPVRPW
jgi:hypothetical protein